MEQKFTSMYTHVLEENRGNSWKWPSHHLQYHLQAEDFGGAAVMGGDQESTGNKDNGVRQI